MYQYCLLLKCDFQYASQVKQSGAQGQMTCTEDVTFSLKKKKQKRINTLLTNAKNNSFDMYYKFFIIFL